MIELTKVQLQTSLSNLLEEENCVSIVITFYKVSANVFFFTNNTCIIEHYSMFFRLF